MSAAPTRVIARHSVARLVAMPPIYEKRGIYDRAQAVLYAVRKALIEL